MSKQHTLVVFSRHPSHNNLRQANVMLPVRTSIRFGSTNLGTKPYTVQLNMPDAVKISANKLLMKHAFDDAGISTAQWWFTENVLNGFVGASNVAAENLPYPIVAKHIHGSRGTGNFKLNNVTELKEWFKGKTPANYIFEKFYSYNREYRLHVTADGCFYTCRKMLKSNTPAHQRWYRNDSNSVWMVEENPLFNKPTTWAQIEADCVKALLAIGLDVAAFDVKVQSEGKQNYIILESNSAPSFADRTLEEYVKIIPQLVEKQINK